MDGFGLGVSLSETGLSIAPPPFAVGLAFGFVLGIWVIGDLIDATGVEGERGVAGTSVSAEASFSAPDKV